MRKVKLTAGSARAAKPKMGGPKKSGSKSIKRNPSKPTTIDEALAAAAPEQRAALEKLRKTIRSAVPDAEECIAYGIPGFRLDGRYLVGFTAAKNHCSFFPGGIATAKEFAADLKGFELSKGTVRFQPGKPIPAALVRRLVKARLAHMESKGRPKAGGAESSSPSRKPDGGRPKENPESDPAVGAFLAALKHPLKRVLEALRQLILRASPEIREGIKWNSPSFRTTDYFATINLRARDGQQRIWLILHTGAKKKAGAAQGAAIADPAGLLEWLAEDRALVTITDAKDFAAKQAALRTIVREWIRRT